MEEGLIPGDFSLTHAPERPAPEEHPAEELSPERPEVITLPEPPVENEASGSDPEDPPSTSETFTTTAAEEDSSETTDDRDGLIGSQEKNAISENVPVEQESLTEVKDEGGKESLAESAGEDNVEEVLNVEDIPQEIEISTVVAETIEEEDLSVSVLVPTQSAGTVLLPENHVPSPEVTVETPEVSEAPPAVEEDPPELPEDLPAINVMPAPPEEPAYGEVKEAGAGPVVAGNEMGGVTEQENAEVQDEVIPEAPAVEEEASDGQGIFVSGDLTVEEILLVDRNVPEPPVTHPVPPSAPSPERESPFTRIADVLPASIDELSDMGVSIIMEVTLHC